MIINTRRSMRNYIYPVVAFYLSKTGTVREQKGSKSNGLLYDHHPSTSVCDVFSKSVFSAQVGD